MAKINQINVSVAFTKNLGNYQSLKVEAGTLIDLEQGDDVEKVYKDAWNLVGDQISSQLALFEDEKKSGVKKGI